MTPNRTAPSRTVDTFEQRLAEKKVSRGPELRRQAWMLWMTLGPREQVCEPVLAARGGCPCRMHTTLAPSPTQAQGEG